MNIILASKSPRRKEILKLAGYDFTIIESGADEVFDHSIPVSEAIQKVAFEKAQHVYQNHPDCIVIGADTIVVVDNLLLGKPKDYDDAYRMIKLIEGRSHDVITGVAVISPNQVETFYELTKVTFLPMTDDDIKYYLTHEEVYDKAGSYAIQGPACKYISGITGDYYNVVGLPIAHLSQILNKQKKAIQ